MPLNAARLRKTS